MIRPSDSALLVVDIQEKFLPVIAEPKRLVSKAKALIQTAALLDFPIMVTEQYPKGLGPTVEELLDVLPAGAARLGKTSFGCLGDPKIVNHLKSLGRKQVIVCGIESHVCVNQTVHQLIEAGYETHLVEDAVSSRSPENRDLGIRKMEAAGAVPAGVESVLFELMGDAKHPKFKTIQALIK